MKYFFQKSKLTKLLLGGMFAVSSINSYSQSSSQQAVVVTGSRFEENLNEVPANVTVITRDEIANSTSQNIPDVLSQIGGLNVRSTNGGQLNLDATVDMGGYGATASSNTLVLVDGQRINPIDSGNVNWESVPIDSIERIEILRGGASVQYGNGAVGGVINIITNGNRTKLNQASVTYGSFGAAIGNAIIRDSVDQTTYQVTANSSNSQGWRQNSAANAYSFDGKITQSFGGIDKIYADLFYAYTNAQNPGGVVGEVGSGNPQAAKFNNVGANTTVSNSGVRFGGTKELNSQNIAELDGYYSNKSTFFYAPYYDSATAIGVGNYGAGNNNLNGWTMNISPRFKSSFSGVGSGILGYDFNQSSQGGYNAYGPNTYAAMLSASKIQNPNSTHQSTQSASQLNQSIYGILKLALFERLDFSGGFRHQIQSATAYDNSLTSTYNSIGGKNASKTFSANAGDLALNYSYQQNQKIYIKWNQSYRFPNIDEYWGWDQVTYNRTFSGILKPQTTQTYEIGGDWLISNLKLHGAVFSSVTQNEIRYDVDSGNNINSDYYINRRGINLDGSSSLTNRLMLSAGGQFQNSVYANGPFAGTAVALAPNLLLNARANYAIDANWSLGGVVNFVSSQHYDTGVSAWTDYNSLSQMPSYTTGDVFVNYAQKQWDVKFIVKNVGNAHYATTGGYAYITNASGNSGYNYYYYPSDGRSVFVTAKYSFN